MSVNRHPETKPTVAVFGAAGHTGRFVVLELLRRGIVPIAIARDLAALNGADFGQGEVSRRQASVNDVDSLDRALDGAHAVINCAGPFLETADAVAGAAIRTGIHYLDVTAEQPSVRATLDKFDVPARKAGIAILPGMGFYGGFADLLVTAALGEWDCADTIEIMVGLDSWHPTRGTRITGERNTARRMVVADGELTPAPLLAAEKDWEFGDPVGRQTVVEVPLSEVILIARHVKTRELHTYLSSNGLSDIRDPSTPAPKAADATGRSAQRFVVDAVLRRDGKSRRITARGRDIYAFTAPLVCEATARLLGGKFSSVGTQTPGTIFDAQEFLSALAPDPLTFELTGS